MRSIWLLRMMAAFVMDIFIEINTAKLDTLCIAVKICMSTMLRIGRLMESRTLKNNNQDGQKWPSFSFCKSNER
jgi:hypothetical protein